MLELLKHTVVGVWAEITFSQKNMNAWPESGDILDLDVIPKTSRIMNEDEVSVGSSNLCDQRNILSGLLGDGDDLVPAPL